MSTVADAPLVLPVVRYCSRCRQGVKHTSPCDGRVVHLVSSDDTDRRGFGLFGSAHDRGPRSLCRRLYAPILLATDLAERADAVCLTCAKRAGLVAS